MIKKVFKIVGIGLIVVFAVWLAFHDKAVQPGPLSRFHRDFEDCNSCHEPWKGISDTQCLQCHEFGDTAALRKEIRFHEARQNCLECHKEHGVMGITISKMDHTLLNERLLCSQCHFDQHDGLFGQECRQCHGIRSWKIAEYRHPPESRRDCYRCHKGPVSHYDERIWKLILEDMKEDSVSQQDCWRCHTIYHWRHLRMEHTTSIS